MVTPDMQKKFDAACDTVLGAVKGESGIGELAEKTVHAVLKNYFCPDKAFHEVKINRFVADICTDLQIIEVQTRQFYKMRRKLDAFLPEHDVTVVYPIINERVLRWIDPDSGEISKPRKSSRRGTIYSIFPELYGIKDYVKNPRLHFSIVMLDIEEYRVLDGYGKGKKKRATRNDGIPTRLVDEIVLEQPRDYLLFVPESLSGSFTAKDFAKAAHISLSGAQITLNLLYFLEVVNRVGKSGNAFIYEVIE